jgi:hypothetical protein
MFCASFSWRKTSISWILITVWLLSCCNGNKAQQRNKIVDECREMLFSRAQANSSLGTGSLLGCMICAGRTTDFGPKSPSMGSGAQTVVVKANASENALAFSHIYKDSIWTTDGGGSGTGSDPEFAMGAVHVLQLVIHKHGISSLLDAPCGAVSNSWMRIALDQILADIPCFKYHGVDVVPNVVKKNAEVFSDRQSSIRFSAIDLSGRTPLPSGYEMILSRDALQHLPYRSIAGAFSTYCASTSTYLLVGSYLDATDKNKDILTPGGCFDINLLAAPFSFPKPLQAIPEKGMPQHLRAADIYPRKYLLFYHLPSLCQATEVKTFIKNYHT